MLTSIREFLAIAALVIGCYILVDTLAGTDDGTGQRRQQEISEYQSEQATVPSQILSEKPVVGNNKDKAVIRIPVLGENYVQPVVAGVSDDVLDSGVLGRFPESTVPGGTGNYSVTGHRVTNGEPFRNLVRVSEGDLILLDSGGIQYTYKVTRTFVVNHQNIGILRPVGDDRIITLITCNSLAPTDDRFVVRGVLTGTKSLG